MKSLLLVGALALSLAANVWLVSSRQPSMPASGSSQEKTASAKSNRPPTTAAATAVTWDSLNQGDDLPALVAGLRAAGFPADLIRRIIVAQLNDQFTARRKQIYDRSTMPFWKNSTPNAEQSLAFRAINDQIRTTLISLGIEPDSPEAKTGRIQRYGNLPQEKLLALDAINRDYGELSSQLYNSSRAAQGADLESQRKLLETEKRRDIVALLTPAELEDHDLRNSNASRIVRAAVQEMQLSEDEFRALFRIVQAKEQDHPQVMGVQTVEMLEEQAAASRQMRAQIRATIGDERFLQYLASPNSETREVARFAANNSGMTINQILGLLDAQGSLSVAMNRRPGQTVEEWQTATQQVAADYRAKLAQQIGTDRMNELLKGNYGTLSMFLKQGSPPPKN